MINKSYEKGEIVGWGETKNPGLSKSSFNLLKSSFSDSPDHPKDGPVKRFLYEYCRKALGRDTKNYPQETGDCVSFGMKNAVEYLTCAQIMQLAAFSDNPKDLIESFRIKYKEIFPPYFYGTSRIYVGNGQLGRGAGSMGSWMAEAVKKYGTLFSDTSGVPSYSGKLADEWGYRRAGIDKWKDTADDFPAQSAAPITTWEQFKSAIDSGYPVTTASNYGYSMEPDRNGFHRQSGSWSHQMCFISVDEEHNEPYAELLNSWGDVHGELKNFYTGEKLPIGVLRIKREDVEKHLRNGENYAVSKFVGFPDKSTELTKADFMLI